MRRIWSRLAGLLMLGALGGCHPSWPSLNSGAKPACDDPCRTLVCPTGNRCVWNNDCRASCTPEYPPSGWKP